MADFKDVTDKLMQDGVTLEQIADAFNPPVTSNTVNRWRMDGHPLHPREGWEGVLATFLAERAEHHKAQAIALHRLSRSLREVEHGDAS